jgi:hypothetical protein
MTYSRVTGSAANSGADSVPGFAGGTADFQMMKAVDGRENGVTPLAVRADGPTSADGGAVVRQAPCDIWSVSFSQTGAGLLAPQMTQRIANGTGVTVNQSQSALVITSGTAANGEVLMRSTRTFLDALFVRHIMTLSQRINNNNFSVLLADAIGEGCACTINSATSITVTFPATTLDGRPNSFSAQNVGQSMFVGAISGVSAPPGRYTISAVSGNQITFTVAGWPASGSCTVDLFGWNMIWTLYNGVFATQSSHDSSCTGWASSLTTGTLPSTGTANPGIIQQLRTDGRCVYWSASPVQSNPAFTATVQRQDRTPMPDVPMYLYVWSYNGTTAPASTTTWTLQQLAVESTPNVGVHIVGTRQLDSSTQMPTTVSGTVTLGAGIANVGSVNIAVAQSIGLASSSANGEATMLIRDLTADTNSAVIKVGATHLGELVMANDSATKFYVKLYNKATAAAPATDTPVAKYVIGPNSTLRVSGGTFGMRFASGLAILVTGGIANTDTSAVTANAGTLTFVYT